jgi:hypothetical protein
MLVKMVWSMEMRIAAQDNARITKKRRTHHEKQKAARGIDSMAGSVFPVCYIE